MNADTMVKLYRHYLLGILALPELHDVDVFRTQFFRRRVRSQTVIFQSCFKQSTLHDRVYYAPSNFSTRILHKSHRLMQSLDRNPPSCRIDPRENGIRPKCDSVRKYTVYVIWNGLLTHDGIRLLSLCRILHPVFSGYTP